MKTHAFLPRIASMVKPASVLLLVAGVAAAPAPFCSVAHAQPAVQPTSTLHQTDQKFLRELTRRADQTLAAAKLAQANASDPRVRQFAGTIVEGDGELQQKLNAFAEAHHADVSISDQAREKWVDELRNKRGSRFDRKFMGRAIDAHEELLGALKDAADDAHDPQLRSLARDHVQHYRDVVEQAEELKGSL